MAIAYRPPGVSGTNASRTSFSLTFPAGAQVGDRAILWMEIDTSRTVTTPAGWSLVNSQAATGTTPSAMAWEHEVAAGEPGSSTGNFSWTTAEFSCPAMDLWSGVASGTSALSGTPSGNSGVNLTTATGLSITTVDADSMVVFVSVNWKDLATTSSDGTERTDTGHGASYDVAQPVAGATGNKTTSGGDGWAVLVFALKPSAAGGAASPAPRAFNAIPFIGGGL
jgi:hypothetical protein